MLIRTDVKKSSGKFLKYGIWWQSHTDPAAMELDMIAQGGKWSKEGVEVGNGLEFHYRKFQETVWPGRLWEKGPFKNYWAEKCLNVWVNHNYIGVMGCAASGKSDSFGGNAITDWYARPHQTTTLVCSTERESLEMRIWGMIKKYHRIAKTDRKWIPGHLIEGKQRIIMDSRNEFTEGRDFKCGIAGVACKRGNQYVGLGNMIGIHNDFVRLLADESNLMPRAFLDSSANLSKCRHFILVALGNPNETTNAHGMICEPHPDLGGWEGGVDQNAGTKTWKTRWPNGICLQLPGSDSPNVLAKEDEEDPFPFLITRKQMIDDAAIWGVDDWHYTMMNEARMPRGQGSRRVLTRQACLKFGAFGTPNWRDSRITKIGFLDAAYRGVGGDRCVFGELNFGRETEQDPAIPVETMLNALIDQTPPPSKGHNILALIDQIVLPVVAAKDSDQPEDQIVMMCRDELQRRGIPFENFFYDAGMRTSLVSAFARAGMAMCNTIDCGGRPSENSVSQQIDKKCYEYYSKFVTELWFNVRMVVESRQFRGMTEEACSEFGQREWKMTSGNKIEVESKVEMKVKTGRSPDLADSIAIGVFGARQRGFIISKLASADHVVGDQRWKRELREKALKLRHSGQLTHQ